MVSVTAPSIGCFAGFRVLVHSDTTRWRASLTYRAVGLWERDGHRSISYKRLYDIYGDDSDIPDNQADTESALNARFAYRLVQHDSDLPISWLKRFHGTVFWFRFPATIARRGFGGGGSSPLFYLLNKLWKERRASKGGYMPYTVGALLLHHPRLSKIQAQLLFSKSLIRPW